MHIVWQSQLRCLHEQLRAPVPHQLLSPSLSLSAVNHTLRQHKLDQAAASTFAAVRLKLEAKLCKPQQQQQRPMSSHSTPAPTPYVPLFLSLSLRLPSPRCLRSARGSTNSDVSNNSNSSRLPLLLDVPCDASRRMSKLNPFTFHVRSRR